MSKGLKVFVAIAGVLLLLTILMGSGFVSLRNDMVRQKEAIQANWAQVDVVLQRRADLIPNLVETVKGYAAHEQKIFEDLANARAALMGGRTPAERIAANQQLEGALARLLVVVENYPNLKANENFLRLQDELAGTENRVAVERRRYNQTVQEYNTYIGLFPNNLVAGFSGFQREEAYFRATEESRQAPKVQFAR
ncbi:MAG: LemA family protein [Acidobacteria bacterium RIFCSPLOWO2_12_FULL_60_22]|nr:MAG: LemA family protein [Acidobacteria bacterium RIFCSPLOWO2_12_FULL_60_22]